jgi:hypothetical protein
MNLKTKKILRNVFIGILVVLFVVGLCYFGWILINNENGEEYTNNFDYDLIENYKKMDSYYKLDPIITIIYASTSKNMTKNAKNVASILKQTVKADRIIIALPLEEEIKNTFRDLPKWMYKMAVPLPEIRSKSNTPKDTGVLTCVNLYKNGNHIGIVLNEKVSYKENYIKNLLDYHKKNEGRVIIDKNKSYLFKPEYLVTSELVKHVVLPKDKKVLKFIKN